MPVVRKHREKLMGPSLACLFGQPFIQPGSAHCDDGCAEIKRNLHRASRASAEKIKGATGI